MYDRYIQETKAAIRYMSSLQEVVEVLNNYIVGFVDLRSSITASIRYMQNDAGYIALARVEEEFPHILRDEARNAIGRSKEFNTKDFWSGLETAIMNEKAYSATIDSRSGNLVLRIDLNRTAGNLSEYARAVDKARKELGVGPYRHGGKPDQQDKETPLAPAWASKMWAEKYYGPAREGRSIPPPKGKKEGSKRKYDVQKYVKKYWKTIRLRRSFFRHPAPWWQLMNDGTTSLDSDWGGTAYPNTKPTRFVQRAIKRSKMAFNQELVRVQGELKELYIQRAAIDKAVRYAESLLQRISEKVRHGGPTRRATPTVEEVREFARAQIIAQLGHRYADADALKLEILADRLLANLSISTEKFPLSRSGGPEVRVRYQELRQAVNEFRARTR